ncbi:hypothetical protein JB92DRAFT_2828045 [Gautieria morchelliformis]|nr:hypothetical protein JB92DRAFT_2828045 [Gautieria morchelliformis]
MPAASEAAATESVFEAVRAVKLHVDTEGGKARARPVENLTTTHGVRPRGEKAFARACHMDANEESAGWGSAKSSLGCAKCRLRWGLRYGLGSVPVSTGLCRLDSRLKHSSRSLQGRWSSRCQDKVNPVGVAIHPGGMPLGTKDGKMPLMHTQFRASASRRQPVENCHGRARAKEEGRQPVFRAVDVVR